MHLDNGDVLANRVQIRGGFAADLAAAENIDLLTGGNSVGQKIERINDLAVVDA